MAVSAYEAKRLRNIEDNKAMLARLMADLKATLPPSLLPRQRAGKKTSAAREQRKTVTDHYAIRRNPSRSARTTSSLNEAPVTRSRRGSVSSSVSSSSSSSPSKAGDKLVVRFGFFRKPENVDNDSSFSDEFDESMDENDLPQPTRQPRVIRETKSAEEITEEDLAMVAETVSDKRYDSINGTTCHQCRQKTDDMKTICRFEGCHGLRGLFCGPCLRNRYGEDAREALQNPAWICPPCRNMCNCSFCRKKAGKSCTGILIHLARERGFTNVNDYLQSLKK